MRLDKENLKIIRSTDIKVQACLQEGKCSQKEYLYVQARLLANSRDIPSLQNPISKKKIGN